MRDNKGFTLIELLAVIIILAIVALIATPIILNVINQAKQGAAEDAAWGVMDAVKLSYATQSQSADTVMSLAYTAKWAGGNSTEVREGAELETAADGTVTVKAGKSGNIVKAPGEGAGDLKVRVSGEEPYSGMVYIDEDGIVNCTKLYFNKKGYSCTSTGGTKMKCERQDTDPNTGA